MAIAVDGNGDTYVAGGTTSTDFPATAGAFQTMLVGTGNAFVTKLNPLGTGLVYSTFLGGNGLNGGYGIAVNAAGEAYVTGTTSSSNFPTTSGAYQTTLIGQDFFITQFNPAGSGLVYSTLFGLSGANYVYAVALDSSADVYVTGDTTPPGVFPTTAGAVQTVFCGNNGDGFVAKFSLATPTWTPTVAPTAIPVLPDVFSINQNAYQASPASPISITVGYGYFPGHYSLRIYNSAGEFIRDLSKGQNYLSSSLPVTTYTWDGQNEWHNPCASGVYIFYLVEPFSQKSKRFILIH
jgi:hypothetical protein